MGKKIFVTGGAGFIGSAIVNNLHQAGHEVMVYDNLSFGHRQFIRIPDSHFIKGDILDKKSLQQSLTEFSPEQVIHLAAIHFIPYCNEHPFESSNINIKGTMHVLDVCKSLPGLRKILFSSTAAVYPIFDLAIHEELEPAPSDIYGLSKLAGEELFKKFYKESGICTIICRFFNAFGPNETNPHLIPAIQEQILSGNRNIKIGNTIPKRDYIHTVDMAAAVRLLLDKFENGIDIFNLGRGIEYSVNEVVHAFESGLGEPLNLETDPARVRKTDRLHLLADIRKLENLLDWKPTVSLEDGIKSLLT